MLSGWVRSGNMVGDRMRKRTCVESHPNYEGYPHCRLCWLATHDQRYRTLWGIEGEVKPVTEDSEYKLPEESKPLERLERCEHLGQRIEKKVGCNGMRCFHECSQELPAVPAVYCQTCESYSPEPGVNWLV